MASIGTYTTSGTVGSFRTNYNNGYTYTVFRPSYDTVSVKPVWASVAWGDNGSKRKEKKTTVDKEKANAKLSEFLEG